MKLQSLIDAMQQIAPLHLAEPWDNVGLLAGDPQQEVDKIILAIDYSPAVAAEARRENCNAVIAYHPAIFHPLKRLTAGSAIFAAIRDGLAIYSPHTALDAAAGGTNDTLADAVGITPERSSLKFPEAKPAHHKLVVFVPESHAEKMSRALFDAGAGCIGNYSSCSFRSTGTGTFFGQPGSHPAVGQAGRLEQVPEVRLETVLPLACLPAALAALRAAHPYEEPAFDLIPVAAAAAGLGRIGRLAQPDQREKIFARLKRELGLTHLLIAGPTTGIARRAAVCAGSCGELLDGAIDQQADIYVTGELRHHDALKAAHAGLTVVCTLHSNSERAVLARVKLRLEKLLPGLPMLLSREDRDPFAVV